MAYREAILNAFLLCIVIASGTSITLTLVNDDARESATSKRESDQMFRHGTIDPAKHSHYKLQIREGIKYFKVATAACDLAWFNPVLMIPYFTPISCDI